MSRRALLRYFAALASAVVGSAVVGSVPTSAQGEAPKPTLKAGDFVLFNPTLAGQPTDTQVGFVVRSLKQDELDFHHLAGPAWVTSVGLVIEPRGVLSIVSADTVRSKDLSQLVKPPIGRLY